MSLERNTDAIRKVASAIEKEPERYDQHIWVDHQNPCGTAFCIAGWAVNLADRNHPTVDKDAIFRQDALERSKAIPLAAREVLGIEADEADILFDEFWEPPENMNVVQALEKFATGAKIEDISHPDFLKDYHEIWKY